MHASLRVTGEVVRHSSQTTLENEDIMLTLLVGWGGQIAQELLWVWPESGPLAALEAAASKPTLLPWMAEQVMHASSTQDNPLEAPQVPSEGHMGSSQSGRLCKPVRVKFLPEL